MMLCRIPVGQRPQQHAVDEAEDGAGGADAEREHGNRDGREQRVVPQRAKRVSKILSHGIDPRSALDAGDVSRARRTARPRRP